MNLYMIGTHHFDLLGPERLESTLNYLKPDLIVCELDEERAKVAHNDREMMGEMDDEDHIIDSLNKILAQSITPYNYETQKAVGRTSYYEYLTSYDYSQANGIRLILSDDLDLIDLSVLNDNDMLEVKKESADHYLRMNIGELSKRVNEMYQDSRLKLLRVSEAIIKSHLIKRDEFTEQVIRESINGYNNVVYVGGLLHMKGDYHNLADRLANLNPTVLPLPWIDNIMALDIVSQS